jgi:hypothetical protein
MPNLKTYNHTEVLDGALGANRTRDTRIRNPVLYPLSYEGNIVEMLLT